MEKKVIKLEKKGFQGLNYAFFLQINLTNIFLECIITITFQTRKVICSLKVK